MSETGLFSPPQIATAYLASAGLGLLTETAVRAEQAGIGLRVRTGCSGLPARILIALISSGR